MSSPDDWNTSVIEEFRSNEERVGGAFEGAPMTLVHHRGRKSGREMVTPMMYLPDDDATVYVFASKGGAPTNPAWYYNLSTAGRTEIEIGTDTYEVAVEEIIGAERDRIYAEQAARYPGFAGYEEKVRGVRTIPVLALRRIRAGS